MRPSLHQFGCYGALSTCLGNNATQALLYVVKFLFMDTSDTVKVKAVNVRLYDVN